MVRCGNNLKGASSSFLGTILQTYTCCAEVLIFGRKNEDNNPNNNFVPVQLEINGAEQRR